MQVEESIVTQTKDKVPTGYQQTEVGVIPEDWEIFGLSRVLNRIADVDHYMPKTEKYGVPYVMTGDLKERVGNIDFDNCKKISYSVYDALSKKIKNKKGDVILARYATVGTVSFVNIDYDFIVSYSCVTIKPDSSKLLGLFLFYFLKSNIFKLEVKNKVNANIQDNVGIGDLMKIKIPLPPTLAEQTAIATALSDMDALIEAQEALLAKKRALKQGAMQELLTGKRRLVETDCTSWQQTEVGRIPGDWEVVALKSIGQFSKGRNIPRSELTATGVPCVLYGEIYTKYNFRAYSLSSRTSHEISKNSFALKKGDILFASSGETAEDIGKCFAYLSDEKAVAGGDIIILRPKNEYDPTFLGYILNSSTAVGQKSFMGQGSSVFHIYSSNLSQLILPFPPTLAEQTAIATALSDMDAEIEQLEAQLAKYRQLKRGMMQELLTGRKRLI